MQRLLLIVTLSLWQTSCSIAPKFDTNTAEGAFQTAQNLQERGLYDLALPAYADVRNKHPYSRYAIAARLSMADVYFAMGSYEEAQISYLSFRDLHPTHKPLYVAMQLALSYVNQLPHAIDRDLSLSQEALAYLNEVIQKFPNSEEFKQSQKLKARIQSQLAQKELYIAKFYFVRKQYDSALQRYATFLTKFKESEHVPQALLNAGISALESDEREQGRTYLQRLLSEFAKTEWQEPAQKAWNKYQL